MAYNSEKGQELMRKYLTGDKLQKRLEHTQGVASFARKVADKISQNNPELDLDLDFVEWLGYVHDIGYSVDDGKHEVHTVKLLTDSEGVPADIARYAMHGQLAEQFGEKEGNVIQYLPTGLEGMILTYADMSVRIGEPVSIRERAEEIINRIISIPTMSDQLKKDIEINMYKALPRFERYERIILALASVNAAKDF